MSKKEFRANLLLLLTAAIWGAAFVAQKVGAESIGAFAFNGVRFALGCVALLPLYFIRKRKKHEEPNAFRAKHDIICGVIAGAILYAASALQQVGIAYTTAGKAGFLTGLYVVLVPIFSLIFLRKKSPVTIWIGIVLAAGGMYLLCVNEEFSVSAGDLIVFSSAFFWAAQILVIDRIAKTVDSIKLCCIQFAVCSALSLITAFAVEDVTLASVRQAAVPIFYGGFFSVGIAYTLQVIAQKDAKPAHAAIIFSLESVFSMLSGVLLLQETIDTRGIIGCTLIFAALIISQITPKKAVH